MGAETFKRMVNKAGFELTGTTAFSSSASWEVLNPYSSEEGVVVFGSFTSVKPFLNKIRESNPGIQIFGSLSMTADGLIGSDFSTGCEGGIFVTSRFCYTTAGKQFKNKYVKAYDTMPNPAASYAFDGTSLIIEAVRQAGPGRENIRDFLRNVRYGRGVTGMIEFDEYGNRISPVFMVRMIKGHPVILNP
jgi:ABC-type branched-subunit amino acid transport system substrate-binding protein